MRSSSPTRGWSRFALPMTTSKKCYKCLSLILAKVSSSRKWLSCSLYSERWTELRIATRMDLAWVSQFARKLLRTAVARLRCTQMARIKAPHSSLWWRWASLGRSTISHCRHLSSNRKTHTHNLPFIILRTDSSTILRTDRSTTEQKRRCLKIEKNQMSN